MTVEDSSSKPFRTEQFPALNPLQLAIGWPGSESELSMVADLNTSLSMFWNLYSWTELAYDGKFMVDAKTDIDKAGEFVHHLFDTIIQRQTERTETLIPFTYISQNVPNILVLPERIELNVVQYKLRNFHHDINSLTGYLRTIPNERTSVDSSIMSMKMKKIILSMAQKISQLPDYLLDQYEQKTQPAGQWALELFSSVRNYFPVQSETYDPPYIGRDDDTIRSLKGKICFSSPWLKSLSLNISQNIDRAFSSFSGRPKHVRISAQQFKEGKIRFTDIIIDDTGPGFPDEILQQGFSRGVTHWPDSSIKGTGTGMDYLRGIIYTRYGGDLIPQPYRDLPNGDTKPGARLILRLPNHT